MTGTSKPCDRKMELYLNDNYLVFLEEQDVVLISLDTQEKLLGFVIFDQFLFLLYEERYMGRYKNVSYPASL